MTDDGRPGPWPHHTRAAEARREDTIRRAVAAIVGDAEAERLMQLVYDTPEAPWLDDPDRLHPRLDLGPILTIDGFCGHPPPVRVTGTCWDRHRYGFAGLRAALIMGIALDPVDGQTAAGGPVRVLDLPEDRLWRFQLPYGDSPDAEFIAADVAFAFMALACFRFRADVRSRRRRRS